MQTNRYGEDASCDNTQPMALPVAPRRSAYVDVLDVACRGRALLMLAVLTTWPHASRDNGACATGLNKERILNTSDADALDLPR